MIRAGEVRKGATLGAPDQYGDAARFHADELQRAMQRDQLAKTTRTKTLTRVRRIVRRVLGRPNPPPAP
jgi:hypothetical protein